MDANELSAAALEALLDADSPELAAEIGAVLRDARQRRADDDDAPPDPKAADRVRAWMMRKATEHARSQRRPVEEETAPEPPPDPPPSREPNPEPTGPDDPPPPA